MFKTSLDISKSLDTELEASKFRKGMRKGLIEAMSFLESEVKKSFGSGNAPKVRSGKLRSSIKSSIKEEGNTSVGTIGSDLVYAPIQEYGGIIEARLAPYLMIQIGDRWAKVKSVRIPARPFLGPTIERNTDKVGSIISLRIREEVSGNG